MVGPVDPAVFLLSIPGPVVHSAAPSDARALPTSPAVQAQVPEAHETTGLLSIVRALLEEFVQHKIQGNDS